MFTVALEQDASNAVLLYYTKSMESANQSLNYWSKSSSGLAQKTENFNFFK
jgi:hypothetical protein